MHRLPERFRRITTSGSYEPRIDALRFVAICGVVLCHVRSYLNTADYATHYPLIEDCLYNLLHGVQLFFALSGYILAQAFFIKKARNQNISLRKYYLRRLTRLEPPYFLAIFVHFVAMVFVLHKYKFASLLPHLGISLLYANWWVYPKTHPLVMPIAWSLEVEIVFYVLFPALFFCYFRWIKVARCLAVAFILAMPLGLSAAKCVVHTNLLFQLPYFMVGFLIADIQQHFKPIKLPKTLAILVFSLSCVGAIAYTWVEDRLANGVRADILPFFLFFILYAVLILDIFPRFFRQTWLAFIGGMCYSLYLTHFMVISFVGRFSLNLRFSDDFLINFVLQTFILLPFVLLIGFLFYIFIERPAAKIGT